MMLPLSSGLVGLLTLSSGINLWQTLGDRRLAIRDSGGMRLESLLRDVDTLVLETQVLDAGLQLQKAA